MRIHNPNPSLSYLRHISRPSLGISKRATDASYTVTIRAGDLLGPNDNPGASGLFSGSGVYDGCICVSVDPFICISPGGDMLWRGLNYKTLHVIGTASSRQVRACLDRLKRETANGNHYGIDWQRPWWWRFLHRDPKQGRNFPGWYPNWMRGSICPDFVIGGWDHPYIYRWYLWPRLNTVVQLLAAGLALYLQHPLMASLILLQPYLHIVMRSDDDRALHDHPGANGSVILCGGYTEVVPDWKGMKAMGLIEVTPDCPKLLLRRGIGDIILRRARSQHRLVIEPGADPAVTLFVFGPKLRDWGFWCPQGWRHWLEFTAGRDRSAEIGKGCD